MNSSYQTEIDEAEKAFEDGNVDHLKMILVPLLEKNIPEAVRINACLFDESISQDEQNRIHVDGMFKAAKLGDKKAKYQVGIFYDLGEYGISQDRLLASQIFKELAESGDPHCMWIYACELIWGKGSFEICIEEGLKFLNESSRKGSANACITLAGFHNDGCFGYEKSEKQRDKFRKLAFQYDDTVFDPYV